ncbi:MAG: hypothetical protein ACP5UV_05830, partial [Thermoplasmata archaeon]
INITDPAGLKSINVSYSGFSFISNQNLSFPVYFEGSNSSYISIIFTDGHGISFYYSLSYHTLVFNENKSISSIRNNEYMNTSNISFHFSNPEFDDFKVNVRGNSNISFQCNGSYRLYLRNGHYNIQVFGTSHGLSFFVYEANFTIITYRPRIISYFNNLRYYSFYGNSDNNSLFLLAKSNISASIIIYLSNPDCNTSIMGSFVNSGNISIAGKNSLFRLNGTYRISIRAYSLSGTENGTSYIFNVNNSIPQSRNFEINTNKTHINLPFNSDGLILNGKVQNQSSLNLEGYGHFVFRYYNYSKSMNYGILTLFVNSSLEDPEITVNYSSTLLNRSRSLSINVSPSGLLDESVHINNECISFSGSSITINFTKNGIYRIFVSGKNIYGNYNKSISTDVNVSYFSELLGIKMEYKIIDGSLLGSLLINGINYNNMDIVWKFDGIVYHGDLSRNFRLKYGINEISVKVSDGNTTMNSTKTIYYFGNLPYLLVLVIVPGILYVSTRNRNLENLRKYIMETDEERLKDIIKSAKRKRYSGRSIHKEIKKILSDDVATIRSDPDGNLFLVRNK